jgi:hypothetical protein
MDDGPSLLLAEGGLNGGECEDALLHQADELEGGLGAQLLLEPPGGTDQALLHYRQ